MHGGTDTPTLRRSRQRKARAILSSDLKGTARLAIDATLAVTDIIETMHRNILSLPWMPTDNAPARGLTAFVYRNIRGVTGWIGNCADFAIERTQPLLDRIGAQAPGPARDALVAALNGIIGDHLAASGNPLATSMQFRRDGCSARVAEGGRVLLMIHGLCMHEGQWKRRGHDHGNALARDLGFRPAWLRYNTGLHVSANGRELADRLERWIDAAPRPVTELAIVGYSLGGLVAHSACHYAALAGHRWPRLLKDIVFLGTPHHGAPLERGGHWVDLALGVSRYSAPLAALGRMRSAGITDLRHGSLRDEDWQSATCAHGDAIAGGSVSLPRGARVAAIAASTGKRTGDLGDRLLGDGLVPVASALGRHADPARALAIAADRQWVGYGMNHLDLLDHADVYAKLRDFLAPSRRKARIATR